MICLRNISVDTLHKGDAEDDDDDDDNNNNINNVHKKYLYDQIMDELGYICSTHGPHNKFT
jgi:hypothetical protein